uniref:Uncharacterized protein n=1 Tax=Opuntia streptacantha TaxID=393608 RepID=A0A7C8ZRY6_OPUST
MRMFILIKFGFNFNVNYMLGLKPSSVHSCSQIDITFLIQMDMTFPFNYFLEKFTFKLSYTKLGSTTPHLHLLKLPHELSSISKSVNLFIYHIKILFNPSN